MSEKHDEGSKVGLIRSLGAGLRAASVLLLISAGAARAQSGGIWEMFLNGNEMRDLVAVEEVLFIATTGGAVRFEDGEFTQWNREPFGILSDSVSVVAKSPDGEIWFGTERRGISILEPGAESWSPFTSILQPIPGNAVRALRFQESSQGETLLLVGAEEGYSVFADGNLRFVCQQGVDICDLPSFDVLDLCYLGDDLYLATAQGVMAQLPGGGWIARNDGLPASNTALRRLELRQGRLIGAGPSAVYELVGETWQQLGSGLPAGFVPLDLEVDGDDVWVAGRTSSAFASQGVFTLAESSWTRVGTQVFGASAIARTASGRLFATATDVSETLDGLWEFDGVNWIQRKIPGPPVRAHYRSLYVDQADRLWFSTAESGRDPCVGAYDGEAWTVHNGGQNGALRAWTWGLVHAGDDVFLAHCCCGENDLSCRLESFRESLGEFSAIPGIREAWSLDRDDRGDIWVSTNNASPDLSRGIYRYRPSTGEVRTFTPENTPLTAGQNPAVRVQGNRRWIGSSNQGVDLWDFGTNGEPDTLGGPNDDAWTHFSATANGPQRIIGDAVTRLEIGPDGKVWIGTTEGLSVYQSGVLTNLAPRFDRVPNAEITAIAPARDGGAWVASRNGGLTRLRPNDEGGFDYTNYRVELPNPNIEALALSRDGRSVWCGTTRGLARFTPIDRTEVEAGELGVFPNPFRPACGEGVRLLGAGGFASGVVVDLAGRVLHRFEEVAPEDPIWDGSADGERVSPGLYMVRLRSARGVRSVGLAVLDGECP